MRRVGWNRYAIGVQAAEEGRNEVKAGGIDQQHSLAGKTAALQVGSNSAGPLFQLGVCQDGLIGLAIEQMHKCRLIGTFLGVAAQRADQIAGNLLRINIYFCISGHMYFL